MRFRPALRHGGRTARVERLATLTVCQGILHECKPREDGDEMRSTIAVLVAVVAHFVLGFVVVSALLPEQSREGIEIRQAEYGDRWPFKSPKGWLRCEGMGAVILSVRGKDYAVNGMAGSRYAPMQAVWDPSIDVGPIISRGLTLCQW